MNEVVNHPSHYQGEGLETIDAMVGIFGKKDTAAFCRLNAFKYLCRAGKKFCTTDDLSKAAWYINKELELINELLYSETR